MIMTPPRFGMRINWHNICEVPGHGAWHVEDMFTFLPFITLSAAGSMQFKKYIYIYNLTSLGTSHDIYLYLRKNFLYLENLTT